MEKCIKDFYWRNLIHRGVFRNQVRGRGTYCSHQTKKRAKMLKWLITLERNFPSFYPFPFLPISPLLIDIYIYVYIYFFFWGGGILGASNTPLHVHLLFKCNDNASLFTNEHVLKSGDRALSTRPIAHYASLVVNATKL